MPLEKDCASGLLDLIEGISAKVAVVGLGYVGLPLAERALSSGYEVVGIDKYMTENRLREVEAKGIDSARSFLPIGDCDIVLVCVPTPLSAAQQPDLSFVREATSNIAENFGGPEGCKLVVLESTSYPGTTREVLLPIFEGHGIRIGESLFLAYAPERVDPGPGPHKMPYGEIPRVVGGLDAESTRLAASFYGKLVSRVEAVSQPEVAEMAKLLENIFRAVNIALVNEMSLLCRRMGIDIWEVVEAASTKPFGFMPFKPGPGIGGHCIPVDPFYLAWKARQYDFYPEFIELAGKINRSMPYHVAGWVAEELNRRGRSVDGSRVLVIGVAYKEDVADTRESPALKIIELLTSRGAEVAYHDSLVKEIEAGGKKLESRPLTPDELEASDCVVILTVHSDVDTEMIRSAGAPVVDTRNALG